MAANPIIEKVRRLIALTASDRVEEARTSAHIACRLIRDHGLHVVTDAPHVIMVPSEPRETTRTDTMSRPRIIRSRFETHCIECKLTIAVGETCAWLKGKGVWDVECYREIWS